MKIRIEIEIEGVEAEKVWYAHNSYGLIIRDDSFGDSDVRREIYDSEINIVED